MEDKIERLEISIENLQKIAGHLLNVVDKQADQIKQLQKDVDNLKRNK